MTTGVQFTGSVGPNASQRWTTFNWDPTLHVIWYMAPTSPNSAAAQIDWQVDVQRTSPTAVTYGLTVKNLTNVNVTFEGRYAILNS